MGIISTLAVVYFLFTMMLIFKRDKIGNVFMFYGLMTLIFVLSNVGLAELQNNTILQSICIFVLFSTMILLFGLTGGIMIFLWNKKNNVSVLVSVIWSTALIVIIFNSQGYLTYLYIPVILYKLQEYINYKVLEKL